MNKGKNMKKGNFKNRLYSFMYGRYGMDTLGRCMLIAYIVILFVYTILSIFVNDISFHLITWAISLTLFAVIFSRMFSRKIAKRRRENEKFCGYFKLKKSKFRDRKTHVYRKCPDCGATLRLPRAKGKHPVVCPRCKNRFITKG